MRVIGLQLQSRVRSPDLNTRVILATFQPRGRRPQAMESLKILQRTGEIVESVLRKNLALIPSGPGAFPRVEEDKVCRVTPTEKLTIQRAGMGKLHVGGS